MKRNDLIKKVQEAGLSKTKATVAVDTIFDAMKEALLNKEEVVIRDFGTFKPFVTTGRNRFDIHSGEVVKMSPQHKVKFTPCVYIKKQINKK